MVVSVMARLMCAGMKGRSRSQSGTASREHGCRLGAGLHFKTQVRNHLFIFCTLSNVNGLNAFYFK